MPLLLLSVSLCLSLLALPASTAIPPLGPIAGSIYPSSDIDLGLRHCNYVCSATPVEDGNDDFSWVLVPALNGAPAPSISFQSVNYPDHYLAVANVSAKTVGLVASPDKNDATWVLLPPLGPTHGNISYSIQTASQEPSLRNLFLLVNNSNTAPCGFQPPSGDAVLGDGSARATVATWTLGYGAQNETSVTVDPTVVINPKVNKKFMGCHSDYGFAQTPRGFTSNLLYGSSFEDGTMSVPAWKPFATGGGSVGKNTGCAFSSKPSMGISLPSGAAASDEAGLANRGLGGSGFAFEGMKDYTFEVLAYPDGAATMFAELRDSTTNTVLARATWQVVAIGPPWGSNWNRYNVTLVPTKGTTCVGIPYGSDPNIDCGNQASPAHICVRCGGEFRVGVVGPGAVNVGFVNLQPGTWGLLAKNDGSGEYLPVLASGAALLQKMGVTVMRSGGTVSQSMRWADWRGSVWNRPSQQQIWADSLLSGWGPFEVIDMCNALDIEPIVTLAYDTNDAQAWADLVEYCWGDPKTTSWGARRAADGHPSVYNITTFELGNEQYNPNFVDQVLAMEQRAKQVGAPDLHYMFPENGGLNADDAQKLLDAKFPVERVMPDLHVGAGGAVSSAADLFAHPPVPGFDQSAINCETNAGTHDMKRALNEAADLIAWFTADPATTNRLYARTASFCTGTSNGFDTWDQGISFFLPNMTWFQPPGYVHILFTDTWAEQTVSATFNTPKPIPFAAQITKIAGASTLVLRAVNSLGVVQPLSITLAPGSQFSSPTAEYVVHTIQGKSASDDNTPANPAKIQTVTTTATVKSSTQIETTLPAYAVVVMMVDLA